MEAEHFNKTVRMFGNDVDVFGCGEVKYYSWRQLLRTAVYQSPMTEHLRRAVKTLKLK